MIILKLVLLHCFKLPDYKINVTMKTVFLSNIWSYMYKEKVSLMY